MYHIKSDKRSQSSAAEIAKGLQECLQSKPLKTVTVSDIHRITGISRATFYRLFDTPEDVLIYQLDQMTDQVVEYYISALQKSPSKLLEESISAGMHYHEFIRALIGNGRFDLLFQYTEKIFRIIDEKKKVFPKKMEEPERSYVLSHLSMTMVASLITWSRNGQQESAADMVRYLKSYVQVISGMMDT